jgi:hypothetical protein
MHDAELDAHQDIDEGDEEIDEHDSDGDFAARVDVPIGLNFRVTDNFEVGVLYTFGAWINASKVKNPELMLFDDGNDNRWAGDHPARLVSESFITHGATAHATFTF